MNKLIVKVNGIARRMSIDEFLKQEEPKEVIQVEWAVMGRKSDIL